LETKDVVYSLLHYEWNSGFGAVRAREALLFASVIKTSRSFNALVIGLENNAPISTSGTKANYLSEGWVSLKIMKIP
jgi:hypothetical protein